MHRMQAGKWSQSNTTEDLNSIYFYNHQVGFAVGNSGVILKSIDSGKTWQSVSSPVIANLNDCIMFSDACFRAVGDSALWIGTSNGGNTWFAIQSLDLVKEIYSFSFSRGDQYQNDGIYGADSRKIMTGTNSYCT